MKQIKHIAATLVLTLVAPVLSAQIYQSKSYVKKTTITKEEKVPDPNPWKKCQWYGRVGVLAPVAVDANYDAPVKPTAGFDLDFGFKLRMGRHGWYWGMDLAMFTAGAKVPDGPYYNRNGKYSELVSRSGGSTTAVAGRLGLTSFGWRARFSDFIVDVNAGIAMYVSSEAKMRNKGSFDEVSMGIAGTYFPVGLGVAYKKLTLDFTMFVTPPFERINFEFANSGDHGYTNYSDFRIAIGYLF